MIGQSTSAGWVEAYDTYDQWKSARRHHVNASEVRVLCGEGYKEESVTGIWAQKTGRLELEFSTATEEWLRVGQLMEPALADMFFDLRPEVNHYDNGGDSSIIRHIHQSNLLAATCDRLCIDQHGLTGLVELKNVNAHDGRDWDDGPPLCVQCQVQTQLMCTGYSYGWVFALIGGNTRVVHRIEPDEKFQNALLSTAREFWHYVDNDIEPPNDFSPAAVPVLLKLHPDDNGETVSLSSEQEQWAHDLKMARELKKTGEEMELLAKAKLMSALGDATYGECPDGTIVSWKTQESHMAAKEAYVKQSRVMRVKEAK
jgi:predicted phage-related endonuclease